MRPKKITIDLADASLTGFASNVTGAAFVLTANTPTDGIAHQVSIRNDSATDHSDKTVALVGTDADGKALTETVTGPTGSATVESVGYFLTLTSATPSATIGADTFDIGWVDEAVSKTIPVDQRSMAGAAIAVTVTGTINYTAYETFDDVQATDTASQSVDWHAITALSGKTASLVGVSTPGATAIRIVVNSYSSGAALEVAISQPSFQ